MKIKFTKHPYPESLDADDAPPQLVSFQFQNQNVDMFTLFTPLSMPPAGPPLRGPPAGQEGVRGSPPIGQKMQIAIFQPSSMPPAGPPLRGPPAGQKGFTGNPRTTSLHICTFFTPFTLGFGFGVWVWGLGLEFGSPVPPRTTPRCVCFIFNE